MYTRYRGIIITRGDTPRIIIINKLRAGSAAGPEMSALSRTLVLVLVFWAPLSTLCATLGISQGLQRGKAASTQLNYESTAFSSPHWPQCCNEQMPEVYPCLFRIPLTISVENVVLAFAEGRPGLAQSEHRACEDGSGHSIWMRRSVTSGRSWSAQPR
eukprot:SAG31_NODE_1360_length_8638_cov_55.988055_1_plen_158_part_00